MMATKVLIGCFALGLAGACMAQSEFDSERRRTPFGREREEDATVRGGSQRLPLNDGRSRLQLVLEPIETLSVDADGQVVAAGEGQAGDWLRREILARFDGIDRVALLDRVRRIEDERGVTATRERLIEIDGEDGALDRAQSFMRSWTALRSTRLQWTVEVFAIESTEGGRPGPPGSARVSALRREEVDRARGEWRSARRRAERVPLHLDSRSGDPLRFAELVPRRYVRDWRLEVVDERRFVVPTFSTVQEGVQGRLFGTLLPGGREIALSVDIGVGLLSEPMRRRVIEFDGEAREIDLPELGVARFTNDALRLQLDEVALLIRGLTWPRSDVDEGAGDQELVMIVEIVGAPAVDSKRLGEVIGVDDALGLAFVRADDGVDTQPGARVLFSRDGRVNGGGEVAEVLGDVLTVRVRDGQVERGDTAR